MFELLKDLHHNIEGIVDFEPEIDASWKVYPMILLFHVLIYRVLSIILLLDVLVDLFEDIERLNEGQIVLVQVDNAQFMAGLLFEYEIQTVFRSGYGLSIFLYPVGVFDSVDENSILLVNIVLVLCQVHGDQVDLLFLVVCVLYFLRSHQRLTECLNSFNHGLGSMHHIQFC